MPNMPNHWVKCCGECGERDGKHTATCPVAPKPTPKSETVSTLGGGMTFEGSARMLCLLLRDGDRIGQDYAAAELARYGRMLDACARFVNTAANLRLDGEPENHADGSGKTDFEMSIDDAFDTVASLVRAARDIQAKADKPTPTPATKGGK